MVQDPDTGMKGILDEPGVTNGPGRFDDAPYETFIIFFQFSGTKDIPEDFQGPGILCKQAKAAGAVIQTMTGGRRQSLRTLLPHVGCAKVCEGRTAPGIRFHTDTGTLADQQDMIIEIIKRCFE